VLSIFPLHTGISSLSAGKANPQSSEPSGVKPKNCLWTLTVTFREPTEIRLHSDGETKGFNQGGSARTGRRREGDGWGGALMVYK